MGRWKRKRHVYRRSQSTGSGSSDHPSTNGDDRSTGGSQSRPGFNPNDRKQLIKYLTDYRDGAERVCFPHMAEPSNDAAPKRTSEEQSSSSTVVSIAGHDFPLLSDEVLARPFLELPKTFSPKQRRFIHEYCVDVGLFHCGVGTKHTRSGRWVVVSIHSDGFRYVPNLAKPENTIPIRRCRPWYLQLDDDQGEGATPNHDSANKGSTSSIVWEATRKGRESIQRLKDQPGRCLRDAHDRIDFQELEHADLSSIESPVLEEDHSWMLVDTAEKMKQCVQELKDAHVSEIGFDLEMFNRSKYEQITCLLQLSSDAGKDYVIDVLAEGVWGNVALLAPLFGDASICKIGHAIGGMDVPSLHRDFGIFVVNAFDTYEAAKVLRLKSAGLASVCRHYGLRDSDEYELLKKSYQNTDWRRRPLTEPMIRYGRSDVHYLVRLRMLMIRDLTRAQLWDKSELSRIEEARMVAIALAASLRAIQQQEGDVDDDVLSTGEVSTPISETSDDDGYFTPTDSAAEDNSGSDRTTKKSMFEAKELRMNADLMRVITQSQERCSDLWTPKTESPMKCAALLSTLSRAAAGAIEWTSSQLALYCELVAWRGTVAKHEGICSGFVCSLEMLVNVAAKRPTVNAQLRQISYYLPELLENSETGYAQQILSLVLSSLEKDGIDASASMVPVHEYKGRHIGTDFSVSQTESEYGRECRGKGTKVGRLLLTSVLAIGVATAITITLNRRRR